jgi:hypothetical protein
MNLGSYAAYDYLRYKKGFAREQPKEVQETEHRLLNWRNQFPVNDQKKFMIPVPAAPENAHGTGRIAVGLGTTRENTFEEFSARGSLHDLEADAGGFTEGSQLEMMHARVRYDNKRGKAYLHEGTFVHVRSLTPWEEWVHVPSWGVKIGFDTARDLNRAPEDSIYFGVSGRSGVTVHTPIRDGSLWYALVEADSAVGGIFDKSYRLGLGGTTGLFCPITSSYRVHFTATYLRYGVGHIGSANILRLVQAYTLSKNHEARLCAERDNHNEEVLLHLIHYF